MQNTTAIGLEEVTSQSTSADNETTVSSIDVTTNTSITSLSVGVTCNLVKNLPYFFMGLMVVLLNALAVTDTCINKTIRGWTKVLLVNLMTSDAVTGVFNIVLWFSPCLRWAFSCDMFLFVANAHVQVLCMSVIYIAASRLLLLLKGPAFQNLASTSRALGMVLITWCLVIVITVLWVLLRKGSSLLGCLGLVNEVITPHVIVVPLTFATISPMYVVMVRRVRKQLRRVDVQHPAVQNLPRVAPRWDNDTRVNVAAIMVVSFFCVCYFPGLYVLWKMFLGDGSPQPDLVTASVVLTNVHACLNPLVYGWRISLRWRRCRLLCPCLHVQAQGNSSVPLNMRG